MKKILKCGSYFDVAFDQKFFIKKSEKILKSSLREIDCFAGIGISGASVIPVLAVL